MWVKLIAVLILVLGIGLGWCWLDYNKAQNTAVTNIELVFTINKGDSFNRISQGLIQQKIKITPLWFKILAYEKGLINKLKAGEYAIRPDMNASEMLLLFAQGKTLQHSLTIPEGWQVKELVQAIQDNPDIRKTLIKTDLNSIAKALAIKEFPEGMFFPDTYFFDKNTSDVEFLARAYQRMQTVLAEEWANKAENLVVKTPYQALILASIVEKETAVAEERPLIAGVFSRRLKIGMRLQTDPTVIYGMGENYHGNIRSKDLITATAYNTYVIPGLPPTPIALPGREAIHAVLHPADTKNLYFVARGDDGSHLFSPTLKQHNRAVDVYQRKKR